MSDKKAVYRNYSSGVYMETQMKTILVIEDEEFILSNMIELLEAEEFNPIGADNGLTGLELAQKHQPDLIICDIMMPKLNGYDVLAELRREFKTSTIPLIFLTAKADRQEIRKGMELGADDYLTKPFTREELLAAISSRLSKQAAINKHSQHKLDALRNSITMSLPQELHNPLHGIIALSELLINEHDSLDKDGVLEIGNHINKNAQRLYKLNQNFLTFAQLEVIGTDPESIAELRSHQINNAPTVIKEAAIKQAKEVGRVADLNLKLQQQKEKVKISEFKLRKIVEELIDNAFKFSSSGTPVTVTNHVDNSKFILEITDHGKGMNAEQISNLGAYMQFDRKLFDSEGSGLGLSIAKRLVEIHDGKLTIESIPNKQTIVRVILPI
jgi:DNA-binding response OmpR family regulator/anti-sigma regulatory factor (Ser/Thr protein kinase)